MKRSDYELAYQSGYHVTKRFLMSRGAKPPDAEELAQAAWARGWEHKDQLRDPELVGYWVNSIANNLFRARFRGKTSTTLEGLEDHYQLNLEEIQVRKMLATCSSRDRELMERHLEGYSAEEIARESGITSTGIRVRMLRIRQSLRAQFAPVVK